MTTAAKVQTYTCLGCSVRVERRLARGQRPKWCSDCRSRGATSKRCRSCLKPGIRIDSAFCSPTCRTLGRSLSTSIRWCRGNCGRVRAGSTSWTCKRCEARGRLAIDLTSAQIVWVNGLCLRCGDAFTTYCTHAAAMPRWCSTRCTSLDGKALARAHKHGVAIEYFARWRIFEQHGWTCYLCREPIDPTLADELHPMYATLDHVVPLSGGGSHCAANLRPAHRVCNSLKGDTYEGAPF